VGPHIFVLPHPLHDLQTLVQQALDHELEHEQQALEHELQALTRVLKGQQSYARYPSHCCCYFHMLAALQRKMQDHVLMVLVEQVVLHVLMVLHDQRAQQTHEGHPAR
jgi:hypothetical protein